MADLTTANSTYSAGPIDTYTPVSDATTEMLAAHINGGLSAIIAMQGDFGTGTALKRLAATLAVRLDVCLGATGGINSGTSFPVSPTPLDGQLFWRTDTKQLHLYDGALAQWQRIDSPGVHSGLSGLSADDHPQYAAIATTETISAVWTFSTNPVFNALGIPTGKLADDAGITNAKIHVSAAIAYSKLDLTGLIVDADIAAAGITTRSKLPSALAYEDEGNTFTQRQIWSKGADIASAAALIPGTDGNYFDVTGTTTITSIADIAVGMVLKLHFDGALTLTHHATDLVLPGGVNIITAAGDEIEFIQYATGDWRLTNFNKMSLARMGTSVLDGSTAVTANTQNSITIAGASNVHRFYIYAIRESVSTNWQRGSKVTTTETVEIALHSTISTASSAANDSLILVNGRGVTHTAVYKVYDLTET